MTTFLEICNNVLIQLRFDPLESVIGNTDRNARFVELAVNQGLTRDVSWHHPWSSLRRYQTVLFRNGKFVYSLPDDFDHIVNDTAWDLKRRAPAIGPLNQFEWSRLTGRSGNDRESNVGKSRVRFTITSGAQTGSLTPSPGVPTTETGDVLVVFPTPTENDTKPSLSYSYVSNQVVLQSNGKFSTKFLNDSDVPVLDADLVEHAGYVRGLRMLGLNFADEMAELQAALKSKGREDGGRQRIINMGTNRRHVLYANTPGYTPQSWPRRY